MLNPANSRQPLFFARSSADRIATFAMHKHTRAKSSEGQPDLASQPNTVPRKSRTVRRRRYRPKKTCKRSSAVLRISPGWRWLVAKTHEKCQPAVLRQITPATQTIHVIRLAATTRQPAVARKSHCPRRFYGVFRPTAGCRYSLRNILANRIFFLTPPRVLDGSEFDCQLSIMSTFTRKAQSRVCPAYLRACANGRKIGLFL